MLPATDIDDADLAAFSPAVRTAIAAVPSEGRRQQLAAALSRRTRDANRYEITVILLGVSGLHRLYLGHVGLAIARAEVALSAFVCLATAVTLLSPVFFAAAAAFGALAVGLWAYDWATVDRQIARHHAALETKVLAHLRQTC